MSIARIKLESESETKLLSRYLYQKHNFCIPIRKVRHPCSHALVRRACWKTIASSFSRSRDEEHALLLALFGCFPSREASWMHSAA